MSFDLNICSLNCHGAKGNLVYINKLIHDFDFVFVSEHWLYQDEKHFLEVLDSSCKYFFHSSMNVSVVRGRPFGGTCWITKKQFNIIKFEMIGDFMSILSIKINNIIIHLIGVYLMYNNNTAQNKSVFDHQIYIINDFIKVTSQKNEDIVLVGDFNADLIRNKTHADKNLIKFCNENNLITVFDTNGNSKDFTFSSESCNSFIDHIFIKIQSCITKKKCWIEYSKINCSDHNAICANLKVSNMKSNENVISQLTNNNQKIYRSDKSQFINWSSSKICEAYCNFLEEDLNKLKFNTIVSTVNKELNQQKIDEFYSTVSLRYSVP